MKKLSMMALTAILSFGLMACANDTTEEPATDAIGQNVVETEAAEATEAVESEAAQDDELVLTTEELAQYNGKDGNKAYVAVDGVIYDLTDSDMWNEGEHNGFEAGKDLTEEIKDVSPHGVSVLERMPKVGTLQD